MVKLDTNKKGVVNENIDVPSTKNSRHTTFSNYFLFVKKITSCNISSLGLLQDPLFAPHFLSSPRFSVSIKVQKCYEQVNGLIGAGSYIQFKDAVKLIKIKDHKKWRLFISW